MMDPAVFPEEYPHLINSTNSSVFSRQTQTDFFDTGSLPSVSNTSDHPVAQADWVHLNNELRQFGFDPIVLAPPSRLKNISGSGYAILDEIQATTLRATVESLLAENKRRQELVNELLTSQGKLQKEYEDEHRKNESIRKETLSYKALFETERIKCQEMEQNRTKELDLHADKVRNIEDTNSKMYLQTKQLEKENNDMRLLLVRNGITYKNDGAVHQPSNLSMHSQGAAATETSPEVSFRKRNKKKKLPSAHSKKEKLLRQYETKLLGMQKELSSLRIKMSADSSPDAPKTSPDEARSESSSSMSVQVATSAPQTVKTLSDLPKVLQQSYEGVLSTDTSGTTDGNRSHSVSSASTEVSDASFLFKRLKLTEKKLKEAKRAIKDYEKENKHLKEELQKRPKPKEWAKLMVRSKEMENVIADNNLSLKLTNSPSALEKTIHGCTHIGNIDYLPIDVCREHLKDVSQHLKVTNLLDIPSRLKEIEQMDETSRKTFQVLRNIDLISRTGNENQVEYSNMVEEREAFIEGRAQALLSVISAWKEELLNLKRVWESLFALSDVIIPWKQNKGKRKDNNIGEINGKTQEIVAYIERLISECETGPIKRKPDVPTEKQLLFVMEHFMKLFDVENVSGVFARMNDLYVRHSEMVNILKTVRELLELESNCSPSGIVNAVGKLSKAKHILHVEDLDSVIQNLEQYDNFYFAFKSVIDELLDTLGVDHVDQIIPAVRALIRFP